MAYLSHRRKAWRNIATGSNLKTGLAAWWALEESSGNRADSHGNNTATLGGTIGNRAGKIGNAADCGAAGSSLSVSVDADFSTGGTNPISINLWFNVDTFAAGNGLFGESGSELLIRLSATDELEFVLNSFTTNDRVTTSNANVVTGTWYMVTCIYRGSGDNLELWLDGVLKGSVVPTGSWAAITTIYLGSVQVSARMDGALDEVAWWNRALSSSEIATLYNSGNGIGYSSL